MTLNNEEIRGRIPRTATKEVKVITGDYWNIKVVDIRWFENNRHTRKGIRINMDELEHLHNILGVILDGEHKRNRKENQTE
tara:strand:+ start:6483 stop:6725 length:243 start_codon:yes stop_codon:yes gene_type:complete